MVTQFRINLLQFIMFPNADSNNLTGGAALAPPLTWERIMGDYECVDCNKIFWLAVPPEGLPYCDECERENNQIRRRDRLRKRIKTDYVLHFMTLLALAVMLTIVSVLSLKVLEQGFDIVRDWEDYVLITVVFVCSALAIWNAYFPIDGVDR